ncbi:MAG: (d)CMP kinase [Mycoplasmoidaceae bacterium]|nr:(d)CMP kinase [Mycoplasmoidaceae bacterium]
MKKNLIQIAIDGPAGSGKTTVGQLVAHKLFITYLSTGKIFRSYAFALKDVDCDNEKAVIRELKQFDFKLVNGSFYINGLDITLELTKDVYSMKASKISTYRGVRKRYKKDLKEIVSTTSLVMDGRDIGTVIIPNTPFKFYLDADVKERAKRRAKDNRINLNSNDFKHLLSEIKERDLQDKTRKVSPLKQAEDAYYIDSTNMKKEEVADLIVKVVRKKQEELA